MNHMKKFVLFISFSFTMLHPTELFYKGIPSEETLNESTVVVGNFADIVKELNPKPWPFFYKFSANRLKSYNSFGIPLIKQIRDCFLKYRSDYRRATLIKLDSIPPTKYYIIIKKFFLLFTLVKFINYKLSNDLYTNRGSFISSIQNIVEELEDIISPQEVEVLLCMNRLIPLVAQYQQHKNPKALSALLTSNIGLLAQNLYSSTDRPHPIVLALFQLIGELYEILIIDICKYLELDQDKIEGEKNPATKKLLLFLDKELRKIIFYFRILNDEEKMEEGKKYFDEFKRDMNIADLYTPDNFIYLEGDFLKINLSEEFKEQYFDLYDKATNHNQNPIEIELNDFHCNKFIIYITPTIPEIIEGYVSPAPGLFAQAKAAVGKAVHKSAKAIAAEVDTLLKDLGLEEEIKDKKDKKKAPSPATPAQSKREQKQQLPAAAAAAAEEPSASASEPSLYTFNAQLSTQRIEVDQRIKDWYQFTPKGSCKGITKQGYLTPGTDRNRILHEETVKCRGDQDAAIKNIISAHQLPYSLIHSILSYGTVSSDSTPDHTSITALVLVAQGASEGIYYQAEIAGAIRGNAIHIWHSFLRPIDNIRVFLQNTFLGIETTIAPQEEGAEGDDSEFKILGEDKNWIVQDRTSQVIISKDATQYILFKN